MTKNRRIKILVFALIFFQNVFAFKDEVLLQSNGDPGIVANSIDQVANFNAQTSNKNSVDANANGQSNWKSGANSGGPDGGGVVKTADGHSAYQTGQNTFEAKGNDGGTGNAELVDQTGLNAKTGDGQGYNMQVSGDRQNGQAQAFNLNNADEK